VLIAFGALLLIAEETRKALLRSRHRRSARAGLPAARPAREHSTAR
jgi:hypothetical protein